MKHIIFFGPPGSGKGTQATILAKKFNLKHFSTGDFFRNHIKLKSFFGLKIKYYIDKGLLVPDDLTNDILKDFLIKNRHLDGVIYDGYPRTLQQAIFLDNFLSNFLLNFVNIIFYFSISDKLLINRLLLRGKTSNRSDDINLIIIKKRISEYYKNVIPISKYYRKKGIFIEIDAKISIENISSFLEKKIKNLLI